MRNVTLVRLLDKLRGELNLSLNPAHNRQVRDSHVLRLQRAQERLWEEHTWPFLRSTRFITLIAGQRLYAPPDDMPIERVHQVSVKWGSDWIPLGATVDNPQYTAFDSDAGDKSWPVERWRVSEDGQIEIWPVPDDSGDPTSLEGCLRILGTRSLKPLVADSDRCDLDDELIVLFAAHKIQAANGAKDADVTLMQANRRLNTVKGNLQKPKQWKAFANDGDGGTHRRYIPTIHYRDRETG